MEVKNGGLCETLSQEWPVYSTVRSPEYPPPRRPSCVDWGQLACCCRLSLSVSNGKRLNCLPVQDKPHRAFGSQGRSGLGDLRCRLRVEHYLLLSDGDLPRGLSRSSRLAGLSKDNCDRRGCLFSVLGNRPIVNLSLCFSFSLSLSLSACGGWLFVFLPVCFLFVR